MSEWEVRVYGSDNDVDPIAKWIIEDRTEDAAAREAAADVAGSYPESVDWSLTRVEGLAPYLRTRSSSGAEIDIPTALTPAERERLQELADDKVVLEIGSLLGHSTVALAQVARSVVSVDPHRGYPASDPRPTLEPFLANLDSYRVRELVTVMVGTHDDVFRWLKPGMFDVAFIDCTGEFELTLDVLQKCQRFLRPVNAVCVHDCGHPDWPGAMAAVRAFGEPFELVDRLAVITNSGIPEGE